MRLEHRLKSLETVAEPARVFVVVSDAAEAERYRAEHPGLTAPVIVTGVPRVRIGLQTKPMNKPGKRKTAKEPKAK